MKNVASNEKVSTEVEPKEFGKEFPHEREQIDKQLCDLVEVIHFTEKVSTKIHGVLDEAEIYRTVKEEFAKSERYNASILLLTDDGSKVRFAETSLSPEKVKAGEKIVGLRSYKSYRIDVNKSSFFSHVVKEGKTIEANFVDVVGELLPRPIAYLIMKGIGYEKRTGILTPLKKHGKVIGVLVLDSTKLAKHFIPSVKNLAQHISTALELAEQHAERKKAEEDLVRLSSAVKTSTDSIVISDLDGKIIDVNEATLKMYGTDDKRDLIGKSSFDLIASEEREKAFAGMKEVLEKGYFKSREYHIITKDGDTIPVEMSVAIVKDADGKPIGFVGISRDITERKKAEENLEKSEKEKSAVLNSMSELVIHQDLKHRILWVNRKAADSVNMKVEQLKGRYCHELWAESVNPCTACPLEETIKKGQPQQGEMTTPDGRVWSISGYPIRDVNGNVTSVVEVVTEITEKKKAEEALRREREMVEVVTQNIGAGLTVISKDYRILWANKLMKGFYGDLEGKICYSTYHQRTHVCPGCGAKEIFETGKNQVVHEQVVKGFDGQNVWLEITATPIRDENGNITAVLELSVYLTERKKMEEALRESKEKYENLFENARDVIFTGDLKGNITDINRFVEEYGFKRDEVVGKNMLKFVPKKYWPRLLKDVAKLSQGNVVEGEIEIITPKGKIISEYRSNSIRRGKKVVGFQTILRNITERKEMEEAVRESEEKYRDIVELAPDGIVTLDMKGVITSCNTAATRLTGYSKDEIVGKHFSKLGFLRAMDIPKYLQLMSFAVRGKVPKSLEVSCIRKDGTTYSSEVNFGLLRKGGKTVGYLVIGRDITERKEMEEKLKQYSERLEELVQKRTEELLESEKRYSVLVEEASDGVVIIQEGKIVLINKRASDISGYSKDELIGLSFEKLLSERCRQLVKERYMRRLRGETIPATYEVEFIAKTSERVPVEVSAKLINYQGRPADLVIIRDISERKRMEEQHLKLEKLASMGKLATMVAHDLRNPLTSIRNASYYIKNTCPARAEPECNTVLEMFDIIEQETIFANNIINDLLDFAAKRPLQKNKQNINKMIEGSLTASKIPENIKVKRNFAEKAIATVDGKQLERVFLNLTRNAVQAMPNGGKLTIATNETKDHIEIEFTDTGAGISEENMSKLFEPLFTTKAKGIGMGLAICKKIVEEHSGTIEVKSKVGQGTTFTIKLPKKEEVNVQ